MKVVNLVFVCVALLAASLPASAAEPQQQQGAANPMQFMGRVFNLAIDDPRGEIPAPGKLGYPILLLDEAVTVKTDLGQAVTADRVQFVMENDSSVSSGTRAKLDCGFVMEPERAREHYEPLICGWSKLTLLE